MKKKKLLSLLLVVMMLLNIAPFAAWAEDDVTPAADATVYVTVSNQGILAQANDDSIMLNREVTVTDLDKNGKLTVDEALVAAHQAYNKADGYVATESGWVTKLWGENGGNSSFLQNDKPTGLVTETEIANGDHLTASVNKDNKYYADWYTFFNKRTAEVEVGEELTMALNGYKAMSGGEATAVSGVSVGLWQDGVFQALEGQVTDQDGKVTLSFDEEGTYYVTASGTVEDDVTVDWSTEATEKADCPIIAPGCVVTVTRHYEKATVYVTVSNQGTLAKDNDGDAMLDREVIVKDLDDNGEFTVDEALVAAHEAYNKADGYAKTTSAYGTSVTKLWGSDTYNTLFFVNNAGIPSGVAVDTVENGDYLTASINKDNRYYADWYTFFDKREAAVEAGEDLTLTLKGHLGMAYTDEDKADVALSGISVGLWQDGVFQALEGQVTDQDGKVTLSFAKEGTYYVTANGTVADEVTDWTAKKTLSFDCPIIAPGCVVTVGESIPDAEVRLTYLTIAGVSDFAFDQDRANYTINAGNDVQSLLIKAAAASGNELAITSYYGSTDDADKNILTTDGADIGTDGVTCYLPTNRDSKTKIVITVTDSSSSKVKKQVYNITVIKRISTAADISANAPAAVETYLPAPGQFVNTEAYQNADKTLSNSAVVTLGSFGGSIVYKYDEPLKNDLKNPYGIDFIVYGNCFANTDGTTASGAAEPAAVMVSKDGNTWYELAGSEYYTASAKHDYKVTYVNGDTSFKAAADVAWQDNDGVKGVLSVNEYHKQPYYPNPDFYGKYNQGVGANTTYNATSASFTGTLIDAGFYPFGYADSHSAAEPKSNQAVNPYLKNHQLIYNGDGFDLSWAVDSEGNPVQLDEVSYIKIYNPTLAIRGSMGESSPEIATMLRAQAAEAAVGVSEGLTALNVNGQDVALQNGVYSYNLDANKASTLNITPTANSAANIYVSNQRVSAGDTAAISAVEKVRIIVQEGEKEPVIYLLNFTNIKGANSNADLTALALTPGDESQSPSEESKFSFSVASGVSAVRFTPTLANKNASAVLKTADKEIPLTHGEPSEAVSLKTGDNTFTLTVTSADKTASKVYAIIVNRAQSGGTATDPKTINVRFSLTGDVLHGDGGGHKNQTWISQTSVTVPTNSTVKYLTEMMLNNAGIDYVTNGIYVSEINGLAEKDNGPYSGWMYRQNGVIADEGYAARKLSDGDVIKWFYTDDYTKETGYEGNWDKVNSGSAAAAGKYIVKFETNGGSSVKNQSIAKDGIVTKPSDPTKTGFTFQGWYTDKGLTKKYDFGTKVTADLTLYAKWEAKKDDPKDDQDYLAAFTDVDKSAWYAEAVKYAVKNNLLKGISATEFAPEAEISRAMFVTVLYRLEGEQKAALVNPFSDVAKDAWYKDAVIWAYSKGIVAGVSEDTFAPNQSVTREQMAAILYQYARYKGCDMSKTADLSQYSDSDEVSAWALTAVKWANGASVVNGVSENALSPKTTATRAQAAAMFMRFCENIAK